MKIKNITNKIPGQELIIMYVLIGIWLQKFIATAFWIAVGYGIGHVGWKKLFE